MSNTISSRDLTSTKGFSPERRRTFRPPSSFPYPLRPRACRGSCRFGPFGLRETLKPQLLRSASSSSGPKCPQPEAPAERRASWAAKFSLSGHRVTIEAILGLDDGRPANARQGRQRMCLNGATREEPGPFFFFFFFFPPKKPPPFRNHPGASMTRRLRSPFPPFGIQRESQAFPASAASRTGPWRYCPPATPGRSLSLDESILGRRKKSAGHQPSLIVVAARGHGIPRASASSPLVAASPVLVPKPIDFSRPAWRASTS